MQVSEEVVQEEEYPQRIDNRHVYGEDFIIDTDAIWYQIYSLRYEDRIMNKSISKINALLSGPGGIPPELLAKIKPEVNRIVHQEIDPVKMEIYKSIFSLSRFVDFINAIPGKVHDSTVLLAEEIGSKLKKYGDTLQGKDNSSGSKHFAQVQKANFQYLEHIRKNEREKFVKIAKFSLSLEQLPDKAKAAAAIKFFQTL